MYIQYMIPPVEKPLLIARPYKFYIAALPICCALCVAIGVAVLWNTNTYWYAIFFFMALVCLYYIPKMYTLVFYKNRLLLLTPWGNTAKEIKLDAIESWTEMKKRRGKSVLTFKEFTAYTGWDRITITTEAYPDYQQIKSRLKRGTPYNHDEHARWNRRDNLKMALWCMLGVFAAAYALSQTASGSSLETVLTIFFLAGLVGTLYYLRNPPHI